MTNLELFDESLAFKGVTLFRSVILGLIILLFMYKQYCKQTNKVPTSTNCNLFVF